VVVVAKEEKGFTKLSVGGERCQRPLLWVHDMSAEKEGFSGKPVEGGGDEEKGQKKLDEVLNPVRAYVICNPERIGGKAFCREQSQDTALKWGSVGSERLWEKAGRTFFSVDEWGCKGKVQQWVGFSSQGGEKKGRQVAERSQVRQ